MKADKVESCFRKRLAWKAKTFANPIFDERLRGQLPHCRGSDVDRHATFRLPGYGPGPRLTAAWHQAGSGNGLGTPPRCGREGRCQEERADV